MDPRHEPIPVTVAGDHGGESEFAATDIAPRQATQLVQVQQEHTTAAAAAEPNPNLASHPVPAGQIPQAVIQTRRSPPRPQTSSTSSKFEDDGVPLPELHRDGAVRGVHPLPPLPHARLAGGDGRLPMLRPVDSRLSGRPRSGIDWIVPVDDKVVQLACCLHL